MLYVQKQKKSAQKVWCKDLVDEKQPFRYRVFLAI